MDQNDDIAAIAAALGCAMPPAQRLHAAARVREASTPAILVHQGDVPDMTWLILDGTVRCEVVSPEGRSTVVATHPPGDLVGAFGHVGQAMSGSLTTFGPARLLAIPADVIEQLGLEDSGFAIAIAQTYARQASQLLNRLAARISLTAAGRINARLLEMAGPDCIIKPAPVVAALAISVQTSRETASRAISTLERRGIIRREDKQLVIQSPRMLEELIV